jgi:hypothetical protein
MTLGAEAGASGSRADGQPSSNGAPRPSGASRRTSPRRLPRDVEITDEERQLLADCVNPDPKSFLGKKHIHPITFIRKYIGASPRLPARLKGAAMVFVERVGQQSCETTYFSYADIAGMIGSPRKGKTTIHRRTAIGLVADLEAYGVMETEPRWPTNKRDPSWPKNWRCRFRMRLPAHAPARVVPQEAAPQPGVEDGAAEDSDVDERRRADREAIEAEAAGRAPPREGLDDVAAVDEDVAAPHTAQSLAKKAVQHAQRAWSAKAPDPPTSSPAASSVVQPRRPGAAPPPTRPTPVKDSAAAAPTDLELAISAARLRSMKQGVAEILALYPKAFKSLPDGFVETTSELLLREGHSLTKALHGIEQSLRKIAGRRRHHLANFVVSCIVHVEGNPTTASKLGRRIVRRVEGELEVTIAALPTSHRGRDPPSC